MGEPLHTQGDVRWRSVDRRIYDRRKAINHAACSRPLAGAEQSAGDSEESEDSGFPVHCDGLVIGLNHTKS